MYIYKLAVLLILNIVFVQAWCTTVGENGTTIVRTESRSRSSTATSSSTTTTSSPTTTTSSPTTTSSTTTTTSSTTTTSAAVFSPTYTLNFYDGTSCSGDIFQSSNNDGCFNFIDAQPDFSFQSTSSSELSVEFYFEASCAGNPFDQTRSVSPNTCSAYILRHPTFFSYFVTTL